ncbi:alanine racemase [Brevundimonas sp. LM2]|uniref:LacI family DNA-binding transcriptional regulator n=1 Tax=Brevundimonas sp. LM2 TaxID=1938605 RepID=UPI000983EECF|nr:LacI family DNA-binding transcriptional regulator [Brevundimonas sp. LM2]AQR61477.1 alanine racemase [Brevundimonas sp. LM2]
MLDVSRRAGVSTKTVSRVLNGEPNVTERVREKVRAAAEALNYHPNVLAQALVRRRSHLIGLVYENPSPSYVVELQMGVLERLQDERYRLVVIPVSSVARREAEIVGLLRSAALDGVVLAPPASDNPRILSDLAAAGIRFARIAPTADPGAGPGNWVDDVAAAREIAEHLIDLGHRRIAVITGDPTHASSTMRMEGYRLAFAAADLPVLDALIEPGLFTRQSGYDAAMRLLDGPERFTAILSQNDDMAVGALMAARERGLDVPGNLSIVGFDDSEVSRTSWPAITTVRQPVFEMAVSAADMVLAQLDGGAVRMRHDHPHQLIVRGSSAPPAA